MAELGLNIRRYCNKPVHCIGLDIVGNQIDAVKMEFTR